MSSPIYYKLLLNRNHKMTVVCLQDFDECDYDQKKFYGHPNPMIFDTEEEAVVFLNENFKSENIDYEYLIPNMSNL